jgi:hypothetical protein|tara:strand:+ start:195 stop:488 length:294 start_codon:yes stop_codon:yes gene_type:complete
MANRKKLENGKFVTLSDAEETLRVAEEKSWADSTVTRAWEWCRGERTRLLRRSDWMSNSDVTMSDEWTAYRKALRDLPGTLNDTTVLEPITWPEEPS